MSEYVEISSRLEDSKKQLVMVSDALCSKTKDNFDVLRDKVDQVCEKLAVRVNLAKLKESKES